MPASLVDDPVFLSLITSEPGGEGEIVRISASRIHDGGEEKTFDDIVRAGRLTLSQSRMTGVTNSELDRASDIDVVLQDLLEFSEGAGAWIVADGHAARHALRYAAANAGFPGRLGPQVIGLDELQAIVRPAHRRPGVPPGLPVKEPIDVKPDLKTVTKIIPPPTLRYGTHLPHLAQEGGTYSVNFRLADSLPQGVLQQWIFERETFLKKIDALQRPLTKKEQYQLNNLFSERIEKHLDNGIGSCALKEPRVAECVENAFIHFHGDRYRLIAWCVMPNHVHVVVEPFKGHDLSEIIHSWKSFTSKEVNKLLNQTGAFWEQEYYDHLLRDDEDLAHSIEYTLLNPERSGIKDVPWRGSVYDTGVGKLLPDTSDPSAKVKSELQQDSKYGRDAHTTIRKRWHDLVRDLMKLPLPLLAEMNWLLSKSEHPLKKLLKKAEGDAVKDQFTEKFSTGKLSMDKLFKDFSHIIKTLQGDGEEMPDDLPVTPPSEPVRPDEIKQLIGVGGPLSKGLDGYEERPEQLEMAQKVGDALSAGKHLMAEAGTGVGKSLAYLVPTVLFAKRAERPVVISTHTKNLQSQLFDKDLPFLRKHLGIDFEPALLKGRPNYLCLRKFMYTIQEASHELDDDERAQMLPIMTWATQTEDGDVSELASFAPEKNYELWDRLHTVGDDCLKRQCPFYQRCFVYKARGLARAADVVVTNHALVFSDLNNESGVLPAYSEIVFDEAHKLEDVATDHLGVEVTPRRIYRILNRLYRVTQGSSAGKGLLPSLLANIEMARSDFPEALQMSIREHILSAMQAIEPANSGSDVFFSTVRQWTEVPQSSDDDRPIQPYVPVERGRGGVTLQPEPFTFSDENSQAPAQPFKRRKPAQGSDDRKRFSATTLRSDEVENFTQGKESAISQLGRLRQAIELLEEDFKEIRKRNVPRARELTTEIAAQNMFLRELIHDIEFVIKGDEPNYVYWSERLGRRGVRVVAAPLDVSGLLHDQLYEKKRSIIFASATLSVRDADAGEASGLTPMTRIAQSKLKAFAPPAPAGEKESKPVHPKSFEFLKTRLGLGLCDENKLDELLLGSPFDYLSQCRLYIPAFLPEPGAREKDFNQFFTSMVGELVIASNGRAMVLYTSYAALEASARVLKKMLSSEGIEVLVQGENESREALLARLREGGRSVLLGTASFWEGVDVRGDALSLLIIAKLPFAVFTDPIVQGRCELLEAQGKDSFLHFSVPHAILKLRQGFGRLIRSKSDRGVVVLADKRVITKRYGAAFLRALPSPSTTMTNQDALIKAVSDFLA